MNTTMTKVAAVAILSVAASTPQAATLNYGDILAFDAGIFSYDSSGIPVSFSGGSFFGMDLNSNEKISIYEMTALNQGTTGIVIGATNTALGDITSEWIFNGAGGTNYVTTAITGGTSGLDMNGWRVYWNGGVIDMGYGAWQVNPVSSLVNNSMPSLAYTNGKAVFNWSGVYGDLWTLDYTATVPSGGFTGTQYALHLEGCMQPLTPTTPCNYLGEPTTPTPEPGTWAMMLAGLGLVGVAARRRKQAKV